MFGSRIRAAAQAAGVTAVFVKSAEELVARAEGADLVLLDLQTRWLDAPSAIRSLKTGPAAAVSVIAFGPHVEGAALVAAREAGADRVLARSAFVKELPGLLAF